MTEAAPTGDTAGSLLEQCSICHTDDCSAVAKPILTLCGHFFHRECLRKWLLTESSCPICRRAVKLDDCTAYTGAIPKRAYNTRAQAKQRSEAHLALPPRPPPSQPSHTDFERASVALGDRSMSLGTLQGDMEPQPSSRAETPVARALNGLREEIQLLYGTRPQDLRREPAEWAPISRPLPEFQPIRQEEVTPTILPQAPPRPSYAFEQAYPQPQHLQAPPRQSLAQFPRASAAPPRRSTSPMKHWYLKYDGDNSKLDVEEFIFRAEFLTANTLQGDFSLLVSGLYRLLGERVANWHWTYLRSNPAPSWESVKAALRADWGEHLRDIDIKRQMLNRRQQPRESFAQFYQDIQALRNLLRTPMPETEFVDLVRSNLLPYIQEQICLYRVDNLSQLRQMVQEIQITKARTRSTLLSTVHHRGRVEENFEPDQTYETEHIIDCPEPVDAVTRYQPPAVRCWNCDVEGHYYQDCDKEPTGFFCYGCGRKGVVKPRCPNCTQKNTRRVESNITRPRPLRTPAITAANPTTDPSRPHP